MRSLAVLGTLLLATVLTQPVKAGDSYKYQWNSDDSLSWRVPGHALKLHSDNATGITVINAEPGSVWGLQQGDVIVAIDDHPVRHVNELLAQLRVSQPAAVKLHLRRGGTSSVLTVAGADYASIVEAEPPKPPAPTMPPMPPMPPSGG
ncbi:MAG: PDZ domain-containing protein [Rhodanobacter sp.]